MNKGWRIAPALVALIDLIIPQISCFATSACQFFFCVVVFLFCASLENQRISEFVKKSL